MSTIWTYGRRPSSIVRYRHGGYNAIYPLAQGETFHAVAEALRLEKVAAEAGADGGVVDNSRPFVAESNILSFPGASTRRNKRDGAGRGGLRAGVPAKSRD